MGMLLIGLFSIGWGVHDFFGARNDGRVLIHWRRRGYSDRDARHQVYLGAGFFVLMGAVAVCKGLGRLL
jgi:hypothetical protein